MTLKNHYVYVWKEQGLGGLPIYVGQGTHQANSRYMRAYVIHRDDHQRNGRISYAQKKVNKLARLGTPHEVVIHADNLTQEEANALEILLIKRLGRKVNSTGILYNISAGGDINPMSDPSVRKKHREITASKEHSDKIKEAQRAKDTFNASYRAKKAIETTERLNDPVRKAEWYAKFATYETREKIKQVQSNLKGVKIVWNGIEYRSKKELARHLGISSQLLNYRLTNNIALDLIPNKGNNPNGRKKGPGKRKNV